MRRRLGVDLRRSRRVEGDRRDRDAGGGDAAISWWAHVVVGMEGCLVTFGIGIRIDHGHCSYKVSVSISHRLVAPPSDPTAGVYHTACSPRHTHPALAQI
jgi:hypothetical protein